MLNTEGERRALELCQEVTRHHIPNRWVLDEIRSIMKEHGDGAVLRDFCHTLQGKLALMPVESWPNLSTLEQGIEMNPQMQRWITTLAGCETESKEAFAVWDEVEAAERGDELESELGRLANVAGAISDAVRPDHVMSGWRVSAWCNPRHKRLPSWAGNPNAIHD